MPETINKFSNNYKKTLQAAADLALELKHASIEPPHVIFGLIKQKGSVGAELLTAAGIKLDDVKNNIAKAGQTETGTTGEPKPKFSPAAKTLIQKSVQIAFTNRHKYIGTEHLLAALIKIDHPPTKNLLRALKISEDNLSGQILAALKSASKLPDLTENFNVTEEKRTTEWEDGPMSETASALDFFGQNLTSPKAQKKIDPVIGREAEISRVIQILARRHKNNPIILGEPGVGKTAIVEGLAKKIMAGEVPDALKNKKIYALDLTAAVAGTIYRGEFEARLKQIIDEIKKRPEVVIFIDEIHNIVGAGSASGSMDTANILKPALARGEIHCIGATTYGDYRKSIESDPALERRFQAVKIDEPTAEEAKNILLGVKKYYENFHQVRITAEAIDSAITLSQRYLPEKFLPDKAIDLIDEAGAAVMVSKKPPLLERRIQAIEQKLREVQSRKEAAILKEDFGLALKLKREAGELDQELEKQKIKRQKKSGQAVGEIGSKDIAQVVAKMTGVPVADLAASEKTRILKLPEQAKEKIIGQDQNLDALVEFIKRAKAGLTPENRPLASFMLVGPSGVGKTYTAKVMAELVFGDPKALIRIDMSEYGEKFNISKLIGAPAGYVGYKESGQLTEKIKHKPYALVLFDEIEKASPEVFDLMLQILDDGYLTDATGSRVNFRNTIIIMTANIGSNYFIANSQIGFGAKKGGDNQATQEKVMREIKKQFKPEFLNRLDKIIFFNPLSPLDLEKIARLELAELGQRLSRQNITLKFGPAAIKLAAQKNTTDGQGARAIKKTIQELVESPLSQAILEEKITRGQTVRLAVKNGIIELRG